MTCRLSSLSAVVLIFAVVLIGCTKKSGEAMILEKEHIAAKATGEISTFESRPGDPEITVDQYVMDPRVRGTSRDPRALDHEQWIVKIRMIEDGRQFNIQTDPHRWTRVSIGDRIKIAYRQGKYTGTIWDAEIR